MATLIGWALVLNYVYICLQIVAIYTCVMTQFEFNSRSCGKKTPEVENLIPVNGIYNSDSYFGMTNICLYCLDISINHEGSSTLYIKDFIIFLIKMSLLCILTIHNPIP